jgi:hypothetical protein
VSWHHTAFPDERLIVDDLTVADDRTARCGGIAASNGTVSPRPRDRSLRRGTGMNFLFHILAGTHHRTWLRLDFYGVVKQLGRPSA